MSDATEYALYRLNKGDRVYADKRIGVLEETSQVREYKALVSALDGFVPEQEPEPVS